MENNVKDLDFVLQALKVKSIYNIAAMPSMVDSADDPLRQHCGVEVGGKVYDTYEWNPLQVAVAFGALEVADYLFRNVPNFHYLNSLSKPLTIEQ